MSSRDCIRLTYDPQADSLLLTLGEPDEQAETWVEPADGVVLDFDADRNPISVEIQNASQRYSKSDLLRLSLDRPIPLADLADEYGLTKAHLRKLVTASRLPAKRVGRTWTATRAALEDYLERRGRTTPGTGAEQSAAPKRT